MSEHAPGLCLDIEGASTAQGAKLIIWRHHGGENQRFRFRDGMLEAKSGLVLDVEGGVEQGHKVIQWTPHGGPNQRWQLHPDGTIRLESGALVLDIEGASRNEGTNVIGWPHNGGSNQRWRLA